MTKLEYLAVAIGCMVGTAVGQAIAVLFLLR